MQILPNHRLTGLDIAKGIGIILVVIGHSSLPYPLKRIIFAFHMPLFFLLSGYMINVEKYREDISLFITKRVKRLLYPYLSFGIFFYFLWIASHYFMHMDPNVAFFKPFVGILMGEGSWLKQDTVLWFLPALFGAQIIFFGQAVLFSRLPKFALVVTSLFLGYWGTRIHHGPWGFDIALVSQLLLTAGYLLRQYHGMEWVLGRSRNVLLIAMGFLTFAFVMAAETNIFIDMNYRTYGHLEWFYISGISGSILTMIISTWIEQQKTASRVFSFLGRESLTIMAVHYPIIRISAYFISILTNSAVDLFFRSLWPVCSLWGIISGLVCVFFMRKRSVRKIFYGSN